MVNSPLDVLRLLAELDSLGYGISIGRHPSADSAYDEAHCWGDGEDCNGEPGGWDSYQIIDDYRIEPLYQDKDTAQFLVRYHVLGEPDSTDHPVKSARRTYDWKATLKRINGKWRLLSDQFPSISPATALQIIAKTRDDSLAIRAAAEKSNVER